MEISEKIKDLKEIYQKYLIYQKSHDIPPKIKDKLACLASFIFAQTTDSKLFSFLDPDEVQQLQNISFDSQVKLFLSVIDCMMGNQMQKMQKQVQAHIKKDELLSFWNQCYLNFNDDSVVISRNNQKNQMLLVNLKIKTKVTSQKSKYIFVVKHLGTKYKIGFDNQIQANNFYTKLASLISITKEKAINTKQCQNKILNKISDNDVQYDMNDIQSQQDKLYLQQFEIGMIQNENDFKILQHSEIQNGRVMIHKHNPNIFKMFMILENDNIQFALEAFMKTEQWNSQITQYKIIDSPEQNCYITYQQQKNTQSQGKSIDYVIFKHGIKIKNRYMLLQKSIQHFDYSQQKQFIRGLIKKRVTLFLPHPKNQKMILLISEINIDFNKQQVSFEDTKNLKIKQFQTLHNFSKYLIQKSFLSQSQKLFNFETKHHFNKEIFKSIKNQLPNN